MKRDPFKEMFEELTDPVKKAESRRKHAITQNLAEKKLDTGL